MTNYNFLNPRNISELFLIDSHSRKNDEAVSVGNIVGGLVKPRGIIENQDEDDDDENPLDVSNAAVSSIHQAVADNLSGPEQDDNLEYYNYTIKSGDTLGRIALDSGVDMAEIVRLNDIADPNRIRAGASLRIPTTDVQMFETVTGTKFPQAEAQDITITSPSSKGFVAPIDLGTDESAIARKLKIYAEKYDLPLDFVTAICASESSFSNVIGDKELENSAYGPMQVRLPALQDVQRYYGLDYTEEDLKNLDLNASIETGVAYLAMLRDNYGARNLNEIAAMYNGGPSAIKNKNKNALGYASKVLDFRDRAMKEYNSMIKVAELGPHVSDGDEMFGVVSGGVTKPETEDRDELLDTTEYDLATDPTSFSTIKPIMKYDIDDQTADAFLDRDAYLDKSRPVAIRGTPRLDQANMPMVNYLIDTNELLANTDITDSDKISRMKASIAELTSDPVNFSPDQNNRFSFSNPFVSMAAASTLDPSLVEKPAQLLTPEKLNEIKIKYYPEADNEDILKVAEPNSTWRDILNAVPPNVRVFVNDVFKNIGGGTPSFDTTFTEDNLSTEYIDTLKDIVKNVVTTKGGSSAQIIEYDDYKSSEGKYDDVKWDVTGLPDLKNKRFNLKTTFGQSVILLDENENIIVKDRFNFNDGEDVDSIQQAVSALKNIGGALARGQFYGTLRKYGKYFGSKEGEGQYISINLGNAKELLGENFDLSKLRLTEEAEELQKIAQGINVNRGLITKRTNIPPERPKLFRKN
tara:strand:+ start:2726 stop:4978 length:2253 start_codon:yes stop_codon:yes gene_type:complete